MAGVSGQGFILPQIAKRVGSFSKESTGLDEGQLGQL